MEVNARQSDESELRQVTVQGVDDLGLLPNQLITYLEHGGRGLLCGTLQGYETHGWTNGRFADRLRVGSIIFLSFDERLHKSARSI